MYTFIYYSLVTKRQYTIHVEANCYSDAYDKYLFVIDGYDNNGL